MHTLNHTLQRGFKFQADAIALGGVTAFMDVIGATMAKPKKTAMDLQAPRGGVAVPCGLSTR